MWPRTVEVMFGVWLLVCPFVFRYGPENRGVFASDYTSATLIITLACLSWTRKFAAAHYLIALVATWLMAFSYFAVWPSDPAAAQNGILVGLLLLMFCILPNHINEEPAGW